MEDNGMTIYVRNSLFCRGCGRDDVKLYRVQISNDTLNMCESCIIRQSHATRGEIIDKTGEIKR